MGRALTISREYCGRITARARTRTTVSSGPALSTGYHAPRRSGHCTSRTNRAHRAAIRDPPSCPAPTGRLGPRKGTARSAHSKLKTVVRFARDRTPRSVVRRTFVLHQRRRRIGGAGGSHDGCALRLPKRPDVSFLCGSHPNVATAPFSTRL